MAFASSLTSSSSIHCSHSQSHTRNCHYSSSIFPLSSFSSKSSFFFRSIVPNPSPKTRCTRPDPFVHRRLGQSPICASSKSFDVVVVGAGVIGLTIARQLLFGSDLSVAVVDKAVPCSGATGAGQGYLWMAHKTPGSGIWELAMRSHELWRDFAESLREQGDDPEHHLGYKNTGSLLIGRTAEELEVLRKRVKLLSGAGLRSEYLSASDLLSKEPALVVEEECGAAFLPDDCQLDAHRAVDLILKANRKFTTEGRYAEFFHDPVTSLLRSVSSGKIVGVGTEKNRLYSDVVVVAAGCWSGSLTQDLFSGTDIVLNLPVKPRKGHLLVLENFRDIKLNHALMEAGYVAHQSRTQLSSGSTSKETPNHDPSLSVSMTATTDAMGNLVLGSSRQFAGFGTEAEESVIDKIWERAVGYFPKLREHSLADIIGRTEVRVGLRPYMPDGKPAIGLVPGLSNVLLATGHEGGGLSMALGTAEMVSNMVLGKPGQINHVPFSVEGRF